VDKWLTLFVAFFGGLCIVFVVFCVLITFNKLFSKKYMVTKIVEFIFG
jgi:hypothetical protein